VGIFAAHWGGRGVKKKESRCQREPETVADRPISHNPLRLSLTACRTLPVRPSGLVIDRDAV
jgi:hypothetical protein